jgi:hypothetical protein
MKQRITSAVAVVLTHGCRLAALIDSQSLSEGN